MGCGCGKRRVFKNGIRSVRINGKKMRSIRINGKVEKFKNNEHQPQEKIKFL